MMKITFTIIFALFINLSFSQNGSKYSSTVYVCDWDKMVLDKNYKPSKDDTCFFVVSTRNYDPTKLSFLDYDYDTTGTLKYFVVYFNQNKWVSVPYSSLETMLNLKSDFGNTVLFTEGLGKTYTKGVDRTTRLIREYKTSVIFFDWPTERPEMKQGKNMKLTNKISKQIAVPYSVFLEEFQVYKEKNSGKFKAVTLLFHSMGNLIPMYDLKDNLFKNIHPDLADNVLLNAACVNPKRHDQWLSKLNISKHIFVTINNRDRNLNGARFVFWTNQLGHRPKGPFCKNVNYVDFSEVLHKEHNYFLIQPLLTQKPFLKEFYSKIFNGEMPQLKFVDKSISEEVRKYLPGKSEIGTSSGM